MFSTIESSESSRLLSKNRYWSTSYAKRGAKSLPFIAMVTLAVTGLGLTSYLSWAALTSTKVAGCGGSAVFNCENVLSSKWSTVFGVPVSVPAFALYACVLGSLVIVAVSRVASIRSITAHMLTAAAFLIGFAALWFVSLQVFVVEHLCSYCLAAHVFGLILAAMILWQFKLSRHSLAKAGVFGLVCIVIVAITQTLTSAPKTFQIEQHTPGTFGVGQSQSGNDGTLMSAPGFDKHESDPGQTDSENDLIPSPSYDSNGPNLKGGGDTLPVVSSIADKQRYVGTENVGQLRSNAVYTPAKFLESKQNQQDQGEEQRVVGINGDQVKLNVGQWPLVGNPQAETIFVEMFDYTCRHCRENHQSVQGAMDALGPESVSTLAICVPMNSRCNGAVRVTSQEHAAACELAELAVAVWRVDPTKFGEFHKWLFEGDRAPSQESAKAKAELLIEKEKLNQELESKVPAQYVKKQVEIYQRIGSGTVPKLLFPGTTVSGKVGTPEALVQIIKQQSNK